MCVDFGFKRSETFPYSNTTIRASHFTPLRILERYNADARTGTLPNRIRRREHFTTDERPRKLGVYRVRHKKLRYDRQNVQCPIKFVTNSKRPSASIERYGLDGFGNGPIYRLVYRRPVAYDANFTQRIVGESFQSGDTASKQFKNKHPTAPGKLFEIAISVCWFKPKRELRSETVSVASSRTQFGLRC